ncbi:MAG: hypothetical protein U0361_25170 [Nitrospiraceae bacterium]
MHMELPERQSRHAVTHAIHAVEGQAEQRAHTLSAEQIERRHRFFDLLDRNASDMFEAVKTAVGQGERKIFVAQLPSFTDESNVIFDQVFGRFDSDLAQEWLQRRDLAHIFRIEGRSLLW